MIEITDLDDERIKPFRSLKKQIDGSSDPFFVAEGKRVFYQLLESKLEIRSVFLSKNNLEAFSIIRLQEKVAKDRIFFADKALCEKIVGYRLHQGVMAYARRPEYSRIDQLNDQVVVLIGLSNNENVGSFFRTASALGFESFAVDGTCANPFIRRSIRVSMGAVFHSKIHLAKRAEDLLENLKEQGYQLVATDAQNFTHELSEAAVSQKAAFIFGSEAKGLPANVRNACDLCLRIKTQPKTHSLNVTQSGAIVLHQFSRVKS
jgi:tRNA G18 (ribose-2'-O)-methylase SpoU